MPFALLMPGHADEFDALLLHGLVTKPGDPVVLEYLIDAEDMQAISGTARATISTNSDDFLPDV